MNIKKLSILVLSFSTLFLISCKEKEIHEKEKIEIIATSFHNWYIKNINNYNANIPFEVEIVSGENGKCQVHYEKYFNQLRTIGTISEQFLKNEIERTKFCASYIEKIDWADFKNSEGYEYDDVCDFLYYYYWIRSQENVSGVEIFKIEKVDNTWFATLRFFDITENEKFYHNDNFPIVTINKENEKWMITEIKWSEKK